MFFFPVFCPFWVALILSCTSQFPRIAIAKCLLVISCLSASDRLAPFFSGLPKCARLSGR